MVLLDEAAGTIKSAFQACNGRAAISADIACCIETSLHVARALHQRQPDHRLGSGEDLVRFSEIELVAQTDGALGHCAPRLKAPARITQSRLLD